MAYDSISRRGWGERLLGWVVVVIIVAIIVEAVLDMVRPLLPWIVVSVVVVAAVTLWRRHRQYW